MPNIPTDPKLYNRVKNKIKKTFKSYPSAYASAAIVKEYKRLGGTYTGQKKPSPNVGLQRWFKERWINVCEYPKIVPCGRPKGGYENYEHEFPLCRPLYRVTKKSPKTVKELTAKERKRRCSVKRKNPYKRVYGKQK